MTPTIPRIKICGLTREADVRAAVAAGADAVGFVFAPSPRQVTPEQARVLARVVPPFVSKVGVFVDAPIPHIDAVAHEAGLHVIQLHGNENRRFVQTLQRMGYTVIKGVAVKNGDLLADLVDHPADSVLLDAYDPERAGGTGRTFDWRVATRAVQQLHGGNAFTPLILAGGLDADNVEDAIRQVRPFAVDVSSGVEAAPGRKDPAKMAQFVRRVRSSYGIARGRE